MRRGGRRHRERTRRLLPLLRLLRPTAPDALPTPRQGASVSDEWTPCDWCGRAITLTATGWTSNKGSDECDVSEEGQHEPQEAT